MARRARQVAPRIAHRRDLTPAHADMMRLNEEQGGVGNAGIAVVGIARRGNRIRRRARLIAASCSPISAPRSSRSSRRAVIRSAPYRAAGRCRRAAAKAAASPGSTPTSAASPPISIAPADVARVERSAAGCDLLLDARAPRTIAAIGRCRIDALRATQPGLAITALSWFGEHGPYRDYVATNSVCRSLAGLVKLVGPAEGPPVLPRDGQIAVITGLTAFIPTLAGLFARDSRARGASPSAAFERAAADQRIRHRAGAGGRLHAAADRRSTGSAAAFRSATTPTKDGWLGVTVVTPAQWLGFCAMIGPARTRPRPALFRDRRPLHRTPTN